MMGQEEEPPNVSSSPASDVTAIFESKGGADDPLRLGNGQIAVADSGTNQIRYFGPEGAFRRAFGRQGGGPGEFQSRARLIRFGLEQSGSGGLAAAVEKNTCRGKSERSS
jgi:hypothetical protein